MRLMKAAADGCPPWCSMETLFSLGALPSLEIIMPDRIGC